MENQHSSTGNEDSSLNNAPEHTKTAQDLTKSSAYSRCEVALHCQKQTKISRIVYKSVHKSGENREKSHHRRCARALDLSRSPHRWRHPRHHRSRLRKCCEISSIRCRVRGMSSHIPPSTHPCASKSTKISQTISRKSVEKRSKNGRLASHSPPSGSHDAPLAYGRWLVTISTHCCAVSARSRYSSVPCIDKINRKSTENQQKINGKSHPIALAVLPGHLHFKYKIHHC